MIKQTLTYEDYNGNTRTEDFWFHVNQAELMDMELNVDGGLSAMIEKIINSQDNRAIVSIFKDLILKAYGEKTADGKLFVKRDANGNPLSRNFESSAAFPVLYMKLATDADAASKFVEGIMPKINPAAAPASNAITMSSAT